MNEHQARRQLRWVRFRLNHPNLATLLDLLAFPITLPMRWLIQRQRDCESLILDALSTSPMRGRSIALLTGIEQGTIYVHLNRMEQDGLVVSQKEPQSENRRRFPRRIYRLKGGE